MSQDEKASMTQDQIQALKNLIRISPDMTTRAKKLLIWLIGKSENLTKSICVSIPRSDKKQPSLENLATEAGYGIHDATSINGKTQLNCILKAMGSRFRFRSHVMAQYSGYYIWLSSEYYDTQAEKITLNLDEIDSIQPTECNNIYHDIDWDNSQKPHCNKCAA